MGFLKWLWKQFLTRPGRVFLAGMALFAPAEVEMEQFWRQRETWSIVLACGFWMMVAAGVIGLLKAVGRALPDGTDTAARAMIDVVVVLFLAFFQLVVAAIATSANPSVIAVMVTNPGNLFPGGGFVTNLAFWRLAAWARSRCFRS